MEKSEKIQMQRKIIIESNEGVALKKSIQMFSQKEVFYSFLETIQEYSDEDENIDIEMLILDYETTQYLNDSDSRDVFIYFHGISNLERLEIEKIQEGKQYIQTKHFYNLDYKKRIFKEDLQSVISRAKTKAIQHGKLQKEKDNIDKLRI